MKNDKTREAFEAFARRHMNYHMGECFLRDCNDVEPQFTYQNPHTEAAWLDWQALIVCQQSEDSSNQNELCSRSYLLGYADAMTSRKIQITNSARGSHANKN
jgi:hypothetical protein